MALPFLVWVAIGLAGASVALVASAILEDLFSDDRKTLGIIGMPQSGKTRFLSYLMGKKFIDIQTQDKKEYSDFEYKTKSGKVIKIKKANDIGGNEAYRDQYVGIIKSNDVIFYFFDINEYMYDLHYMRECNSRIAYMLEDIAKTQNRRREDWKQCLSGKNWKRLVVFATHRDKVKLDDAKLKEKFNNSIRDKWYKGVSDNVVFIDTTNEKGLVEICDIIFK